VLVLRGAWGVVAWALPAFSCSTLPAFNSLRSTLVDLLGMVGADAWCRKLEEDVGLLQMQLHQRENELVQLQQQVRAQVWHASMRATPYNRRPACRPHHAYGREQSVRDHCLRVFSVSLACKSSWQAVHSRV
jgi:hypothetical protein